MSTQVGQYTYSVTISLEIELNIPPTSLSAQTLEEVPSNDFESLYNDLQSSNPTTQCEAAKQLLNLAQKHEDNNFTVCEKLFIALPQLLAYSTFTSLENWQTAFLSLLKLDTSLSVPVSDINSLSAWLILLQSSSISAAHKAFEYLVNTSIKSDAPSLFAAAINFNEKGLARFLNVLKANQVKHFEMLTYLWCNYSKKCGKHYSAALVSWTLTHMRMPESIIQHLSFLESLSLPPRFLKTLYTKLWTSRDFFQKEDRRLLCLRYFHQLVHSGFPHFAKRTLLENKSYFDAESFDLHLELIQKKIKDSGFCPLEKSIKWLAPLKRQFSEALDKRNYALAISALIQLKTLLPSGDKRLHLSGLILILLKQLANEKNENKKCAALQEFDALWKREKDLDIWMAQPPLFAQGVVLYLNMTNVDAHCPLIKKLLTLQNREHFQSVSQIIPAFLNYLVKQVKWDKDLILQIEKWFLFNRTAITLYLSKQPPSQEFHCKLATLCCSQETLKFLFEICIKNISLKEFVQNHPKEIQALLTAMVVGKDLKAIAASTTESIFFFMECLAYSEHTYAYAKPILVQFLRLDDSQFQLRPHNIQGYVNLIDALICHDLELAEECLKILAKYTGRNYSGKFKSYLTALSGQKKLSEALQACATFSQFLSERELIPTITENDLDNPPLIVQNFLIKYRDSIDPVLWIRFCIELFQNARCAPIREYLQQISDSLKAINKDTSKIEKLLAEPFIKTNIYSFLLFFIGILEKKAKQDLLNAALDFVIANYDPLHTEQVQIICECQREVLLQSSEEALKTFRSKVQGLPGFTSFQEVSALRSLPATENVRSIFFRINHLIDYRKTLSDKSSYSVLPSLNGLIQQLLGKNLQNERTRYFELIAQISQFDTEELETLAHEEILLSIITSKCIVVEESFTDWMGIILKVSGQTIVDLVTRQLEAQLKTTEVSDIDFSLITSLLNNRLVQQHSFRFDLFQSILITACKKVEKDSIMLPKGAIAFFVPKHLYFFYLEKLLDLLCTYIELCTDKPEFLETTFLLFSCYCCFLQRELLIPTIERSYQKISMVLNCINDSNLNLEIKFTLLFQLNKSMFIHKTCKKNMMTATEIGFTETALNTLCMKASLLSQDNLLRLMEFLHYTIATCHQNYIITITKQVIKKYFEPLRSNIQVAKLKQDSSNKIMDTFNYYLYHIGKFLKEEKYNLLNTPITGLCSVFLGPIKNSSSCHIESYLKNIITFWVLINKNRSNLSYLEHVPKLIRLSFDLYSITLKKNEEIVRDYGALIYFETINYCLDASLANGIYFAEKDTRTILFSGVFSSCLDIFLDRKNTQNAHLKTCLNKINLMPRFITHCFTLLKIYNLESCPSTDVAINELEDVLNKLKASPVLVEWLNTQPMSLEKAYELFQQLASVNDVYRYKSQLNKINDLYLELLKI